MVDEVNEPKVEERKGAKSSPVETYKPEREEDFQELDRRDDTQIIEEMQGKVLSTYFYSFDSRGKRVVGISYSGTKAVAQKLGKITIKEHKVWSEDNAFHAVVVVRDTVRELETIGAASCTKFEKVLNNMTKQTEEKPVAFALPKVISKAYRNALRSLIPEATIVEMYKEWEKRGGGRE